MKKQRCVPFVVKLVCFLLPVALLLSPVAFAGEMLSGGVVSRMQHVENRPILYGVSASDRAYAYYKAQAGRALSPEVFIMGDSRALQVRSFFFRQPQSVYNAGFVTRDLVAMQNYLESQNPGACELAVISLDHVYFHPEFVDYDLYAASDVFTNAQKGKGASFSTAAKSCFELALQYDGFMEKVFDPRYIGGTALVSEGGFLNDGSYYYGSYYEAMVATQGEGNAGGLAAVLQEIEEGKTYFLPGDTVPDAAWNQLEQFLSYCAQNDIYVVCYVPPYPPVASAAFAAAGARYAYRQELRRTAPAIFAKYGFEYYDYGDVAALGCTDSYFMDGIHGGDVVYLRMFIDMLRQGSRLNEYCDIAALRQYDANRYADICLLQTLDEYQNAYLHGDVGALLGAN